MTGRLRGCQCLSQVTLQRAAGLSQCFHAGFKKTQRASPGCFGTVQRKVRAFEQGLRTVTIKRCQGNANAHPNLSDGAAQVKRFAQRSDGPPCQCGAAEGLLRATLENGKFIAAQARHIVSAVCTGAQPFGHLDQQCVAHCMAERVVDCLEAVQIHAKHRQLLTACVAHHLAVKLIAHGQAVGQAGERVVVGLKSNLRLPLPLLGDVFMKCDAAAVRQVRRHDFNTAPVVQQKLTPMLACNAFGQGGLL